MIRHFVFTAGNYLSRKTEGTPDLVFLTPGKTDDLPFSPLEQAMKVQVKAAQMYDTKVDLSQWSQPEESP